MLALEKKKKVSNNLRSHCKILGKREREKKKQIKQKKRYNEEHKSMKFKKKSNRGNKIK